jgi:integrin beta 8
MWIGYSFLMYTGAGKSGGGTHLSSPGSCLEEFRGTPFIECHGRGTCDFYHNAYSFWLAIIEEEQQFMTPIAQVTKAGNLQNRLSRCAVCKRNAIVSVPEEEDAM